MDEGLSIHFAQAGDGNARLRAHIAKVLSEVGVGVLATQGQGQPYASLVAFAASDDLSQLVFATPRATRKYSNLASEPRVAMLIDTRQHTEDDLQVATGITATGRAVEQPRWAGPMREKYLARHPSLGSFVDDPQCARFRIEVRRYVVVRRFQEVMELNLPAAQG